MISGSRKTWTGVVLIVLGFAAVVFTTRYVETVRPPLPQGYEDQDLALQGSRLKGWVLGTEGLLADWYWMRSLQYIGGKISSVGLDRLNLEDMRSLNPRLLYPYLNNATDLDPRFIAPYSYGATILPAIDPQQAIALTEKGIANNPDQWRLHQYLGYIHWKLGNYEAASEVYGQGANVPGSPPFMRMMAARMKTEGGSRDIAREMYRQILTESQDEVSRQNAELRLMQIDSLDERDLLDEALRQFRDRTGRCAARWQEVLPVLAGRPVANGRDPRIDRSNNVVDPSGVPYLIDARECKAILDLSRSKVPGV